MEPKTYDGGFVPADRITAWLEAADSVDSKQVRELIEKAREARGLTPQEAAVLLNTHDPELLDEMLQAAQEVKMRIYGTRIVLFAPLYISNYCINDCRYCGYGFSKNLARRRLTPDEIATEVKILEDMGHKRIALETGEDPRNCPIDYVLEAIETIYATTSGRGSIRRINVNIAATTIQEYRLLKQAKIGTYVLFQETYHRPTYEMMHPRGPKSDYIYHLTAMDRAMQAGIDDVGLGVLYGLYDFKFETLALLAHASHLEKHCGVGPHTVSVPRLRPARGVTLDRFPHLVSDSDFQKVVAVLRLALPYTGIILSTRERPGFRDQVISHGVSQISAGSCTGVGGYHERQRGQEDNLQFSVEDHRSSEEVIASLCASGFLPSYCTACYRSGRTGERFMRLAKTGQIQNVCLPNALLTFQEYLIDYAGPELQRQGEKTIEEHLKQIPSDKVRSATMERLEMIKNGKRDLYF